MSEMETRYLRNLRLKIGAGMLSLLLVCGFFLWRDIHQGHYFRIALFGSLGVFGALRCQRNFKRAGSR